MSQIENLNEDQIDAVKETGNIGCSHAATAVSNMLGRSVDISVPNLRIEKIEQMNNVFSNIFDEKEKIVGVYLELTDEFSGSILMLFTMKSALSLSDTLVGQEPGTSTELDEMSRSAITEVGNIVVSAYTNALGALIDSTVMLSPPTFAEDMPEGIIDKVSSLMGDESSHALIFDIKFTGEGDLFDSYFILLPSPKSLDILLKKLGFMVTNNSDSSVDDAKDYAESLLK